MDYVAPGAEKTEATNAVEQRRNCSASAGSPDELGATPRAPPELPLPTTRTWACSRPARLARTSSGSRSTQPSSCAKGSCLQLSRRQLGGARRGQQHEYCSRYRYAMRKIQTVVHRIGCECQPSGSKFEKIKELRKSRHTVTYRNAR